MVAAIQIFFFLMIYLNLFHGVLIKIAQEKKNEFYVTENFFFKESERVILTIWNLNYPKTY